MVCEEPLVICDTLIGNAAPLGRCNGLSFSCDERCRHRYKTHLASLLWHTFQPSNNMEPCYLLRHHPLITPCIEFQLAPPPPLPNITPRTEFGPENLVPRRRTLEEDGPTRESKRRRLSTSGRVPDQVYQDEDSDRDSDQPLPSALLPGPSTLIPKPTGEPGRPGSGGFCLEDALVRVHGWSQREVDELQVCGSSYHITTARKF